MLKTNVMTRDYKITARTPQGMEAMCIVQAESREAARMKANFPADWTILEVIEL